MNQRPGDAEPPSGRGIGRDRSGLGPRRVVATAFGLSAALHVILIAWYAAFGLELRPERVEFRLPTSESEPDGVQVLRLIEFAADDDPERPDAPVQIEEVAPVAVSPIPVTLDRDPGVDLGPPPRSGADRLRPDLKDRRLWAPLDPSVTDLSVEQREELLLSDRIMDWYDSLTIAAEAEAALTDWTFTDSEGKRWGAADGKIYLGDVVLPGNHFFGVPIGKREEYAERMWQWDEIQRQGARMEVIETWKVRQEAIRARRDKERAAIPDTSRVRR